MDTLFVSALPFKATEAELKTLFEQYGRVHSVEIFADWINASFEPYAHIRMDQADEAIVRLDGKIIGSTYLRVNHLATP
jgi:RNA recognition motif-containing protein